MQYLRGLTRGVEDTKVCLFSKEEIQELNGIAGACFDGEVIKVMPNTPIWKLAHEIKHARDFKTHSKSLLGKLSILNAALGNKAYKYSKGTPLEGLGKWWYNATKFEKNAYSVERKVREHYGYTKRNSRQNVGNVRQGFRGTSKKQKAKSKISFFSAEENSTDDVEISSKIQEEIVKQLWKKTSMIRIQNEAQMEEEE